MKTTNANIRKVSHDLATVRAASSVSGASEVTYSVVPNAMPASQEAAPYLGRSHVAGSCSQDELAADMVANGCQMNVEEIKRVWNGFGAYLLDRMPEAPRVFDLGFARFWPVIGGTFPASDAEFDPERNELYVAAAPSAAIRNALAGGTPTATGIPPAASVIYNVQRQGTDVANTIRSGEPFWILGRNLTLGYGGEHAELELPDGGGTVLVTLEVQVDEDGSQRIVGRLAQAVDACEGAKLTLWTRGLSPEREPFAVPSGKLTVLAGDVPPPVGPTVTAINDGTFHAGAGNVITGANMRFADAFPGNHILIKDAQGTDMEAMISTDAEIPVTETRFALNLDEGQPLTDGEEYTFEFEMVDADNQPVTVTHAARWRAS